MRNVNIIRYAEPVNSGQPYTLIWDEVEATLIGDYAVHRSFGVRPQEPEVWMATHIPAMSAAFFAGEYDVAVEAARYSRH